MNNKTITVETAIGSCSRAVRAELEAATGAFAHVAATQAVINDGRTGAYSRMMEVAFLVRATADELHPADRNAVAKTLWEAYKADISVNRDGMAARLGCKRGKATKNKPAGWLVPSEQSSAASVVLDCLALDIPLHETGGPERSFTAVRADVQAKNRERRIAALGADAILLDKRITELRQLAGNYAERFEEIARAGNAKAVCEILAASIGAALPYMMGLEKATADAKPEAQPETGAGDIIAEAVEAPAKPKRQRGQRAA